MPDQLQQLVDLIKDGQTRAQAERLQVQEKLAEMDEKILDLQTSPPKEPVDLSAALTEMKGLLDSISTIYSPPPDVEEKITEAEAEQQQQQEDGELTEESKRQQAEEKQTQQIKTLTKEVDPADVLVSIPDHMKQPPDAPEGVVFKE